MPLANRPLGSLYHLWRPTQNEKGFHDPKSPLQGWVIEVPLPLPEMFQPPRTAETLLECFKECTLYPYKVAGLLGLGCKLFYGEYGKEVKADKREREQLPSFQAVPIFAACMFSAVPYSVKPPPPPAAPPVPMNAVASCSFSNLAPLT